MSVAAPAAPCCCPADSEGGIEGIAVSVVMPGPACCGPARPKAEPEPAPEPTEEPLDLTITGRGKIRQDNLTSGERNLAVLIHLISLPAFFVIGPFAGLATLTLWLLGRDRSLFIDEHGREAVNFEISYFLYHVVLAVTIVGIVLFPLLWIMAIVSQIRGAVAAGAGEYFRYPMIIRFLS